MYIAVTPSGCSSHAMCCLIHTPVVLDNIADVYRLQHAAFAAHQFSLSIADDYQQGCKLT